MSDDYRYRNELAELILSYLTNAYDDGERRADDLIAIDLADLIIEARGGSSESENPQ